MWHNFILLFNHKNLARLLILYQKHHTFLEMVSIYYVPSPVFSTTHTLNIWHHTAQVTWTQTMTHKIHKAPSNYYNFCTKHNLWFLIHSKWIQVKARISYQQQPCAASQTIILTAAKSRSEGFILILNVSQYALWPYIVTKMLGFCVSHFKVDPIC